MKLISLIFVVFIHISTSHACPKVNFDKVLCNDITNSQYFKGHLSLNIYEDDHSHILSAIGDQFFWFVRIPSVGTSDRITQIISCENNRIIFEDQYQNITYSSILTVNENGFNVSGVILESRYSCEDDGEVHGCRLVEPKKVLIRSRCLTR